jgi:hypothetical protein
MFRIDRGKQIFLDVAAASNSEDRMRWHYVSTKLGRLQPLTSLRGKIGKLITVGAGADGMAWLSLDTVAHVQ